LIKEKKNLVILEEKCILEEKKLNKLKVYIAIKNN
jgi:hypothetical protein